jgi:2-polyprenyl-3-methyl-5-hydroxy-6-metoxy-1,4-benzoquinol methylase
VHALEATQREHAASVETVRAAAQRNISDATTSTLEISARIDAAEDRLASLGEVAERLLQDTSKQSVLGQRLSSIDEAVTTLTDRLYAVPYMADERQFQIVNDAGRPALGFRAAAAAPLHGYRRFEDFFRGPEPFILERQRVYLPWIAGLSPVVDIGSGRGEMLDLLRESGIAAIGVDADAGMIDRCRAKGHPVEHVDGISYLRCQRDGSLGAIFSAQVIEHLRYEELMSFLTVSFAKLRPGGRLIVETVNPHAIEAFKTFWTDLTHVRPIFPEVLLAWCCLAGFERADVIFPKGTGDLHKDRRVQGEYAVIALR